MKAVPVAINLIRIVAESQSRATTDPRTVEEYAQAWRSDAEFPPVDLFVEGSVYYPGDGMHRILAAKLAGRAAILAYVYRGNEREAFLFGCASNHTHGLRRSNADKRHMVSRMLNDSEWVKWSDRRIAEQCGVSAQFVTNVRNELSTVDSSPARRHANYPRLGADGKFRRPPEVNGEKRLAMTKSAVRLSQVPLVKGVSGKGRGVVDRYCDLPARRQEAIVLMEELKQLLQILDLYEFCAHDFQSISERIKSLNLEGISA